MSYGSPPTHHGTRPTITRHNGGRSSQIAMLAVRDVSIPPYSARVVATTAAQAITATDSGPTLTYVVPSAAAVAPLHSQVLPMAGGEEMITMANTSGEAVVIKAGAHVASVSIHPPVGPLTNTVVDIPSQNLKEALIATVCTLGDRFPASPITELTARVRAALDPLHYDDSPAVAETRALLGEMIQRRLLDRFELNLQRDCTQGVPPWSPREVRSVAHEVRNGCRWCGSFYGDADTRRQACGPDWSRFPRCTGRSPLTDTRFEGTMSDRALWHAGITTAALPRLSATHLVMVALGRRHAATVPTA